MPTRRALVRLDSAARGPPASTRRSPPARTRWPRGTAPAAMPAQPQRPPGPARSARTPGTATHPEHRLQIPLALGQTHPQARPLRDHLSPVLRGRAGLPGHHREHAPGHVGVEETRVSLTAEMPPAQLAQHPTHLNRGRQPRGRQGIRCSHLPQGTSEGSHPHRPFSSSRLS